MRGFAVMRTPAWVITVFILSVIAVAAYPQTSEQRVVSLDPQHDAKGLFFKPPASGREPLRECNGVSPYTKTLLDLASGRPLLVFIWHDAGDKERHYPYFDQIRKDARRLREFGIANEQDVQVLILGVKVQNQDIDELCQAYKDNNLLGPGGTVLLDPYGILLSALTGGDTNGFVPKLPMTWGGSLFLIEKSEPQEVAA